MTTSGRSKDVSNSGKRRRTGVPARRGLDRPFDPAILRQAKNIARRYQVVMRREERAYFGRGLELPGALGDGATPAQCMESVEKSMTAVVAFMLECGQTPPAPASEETKPVQLNIRIPVGDKLIFEEAARQRGQGLSEFIRSAALERAAG